MQINHLFNFLSPSFNNLLLQLRHLILFSLILFVWKVKFSFRVIPLSLKFIQKMLDFALGGRELIVALSPVLVSFLILKYWSILSFNLLFRTVSSCFSVCRSRIWLSLFADMRFSSKEDWLFSVWTIRQDRRYSFCWILWMYLLTFALIRCVIIVKVFSSIDLKQLLLEILFMTTMFDVWMSVMQFPIWHLYYQCLIYNYK